MKTAIFDLDNSLLADNSLRLYARHMMGVLLRRRRLVRLVALICHISFRRLRIVSHITMKQHLMHLTIHDFDTPALNAFIRTLQAHVDPRALALFNRWHSQGWLILLATAAPSCYADEFARRMGFDGVCATQIPADDSPMTECRGEEKLRCAINWLEAHNASLEALVTDHHDDLPLLRLPKHLNILVDPSEKTLSMITGIPFVTIDNYLRN
ncbi:MAG: HAD family hydrolase [Muribaculaceae bacterium]